MPNDFANLIHDACHPGPRATRAAARLMSRLEDEPTRLPALLRGAAEALGVADPTELPQPALVLGITGAPGCGKSTLTDAVVTAYRQRYPEKRVGVIAVDPSSPFTGGALLGDRVRMMRHATDPKVFVRSMASRGHLGGLSLGVKGVARAMGLIGCDLVVIETVGVGQSEIEVVQVADCSMVVLAPGQGDSVQLLKAGLMEIGDIFVVNKADRDGADQLYSQLMQALHMDLVSAHHHGDAGDGHHGPQAAGQREPGGDITLPQQGCAEESSTAPQNGDQDALEQLALEAGEEARVFLVAASDGRGIPELLDHLDRLTAAHHAAYRQRRQQAVRDELREAILEAARKRLLEAMGPGDWLGRQVQAALDKGASVESLAQALLERAAAGQQDTTTPSGNEIGR